MNTMKLFTASFGILGTGMLADRYAHLYDLYFVEGWFDTPMHFFCGIGAGFLTLWFIAVMGLLPTSGQVRPSWDGSFGRHAPWWRTYIAVFAGVALIGVVWELYEVGNLALADKPLPYGYLFDTSKDIINDLLGATVAWATFRKVQLNAWQAEMA